MRPQDFIGPTAPVLCPYCGARAKFVSGAEVYPHRKDLYEKNLYVCSPCKARVGCHPSTNIPLGALADDKTRQARMRAHYSFDAIWKFSRHTHMGRASAYHWLASELGIDRNECHIGSMNVDQCDRVILICRAKLESLGILY